MSQKKTPKSVGRPRFQPTAEERKIVEMMAALGTPLDDMARNVRKGGIDVKTLRKHFDEEISTGATRANIKVGGAMYNKALGGDVQAQKYFLSCRAGWTEKNAIEVSGGVTIELVDFTSADKN